MRTLSLSPEGEPALHPAVSTFMRAVINAAEQAGSRGIDWREINRLSSDLLWPVLVELGDGDGQRDLNTSSLGHAVVLQLHAAGLVAAETSKAPDGTVMAQRVHPGRGADELRIR